MATDHPADPARTFPKVTPIMKFFAWEHLPPHLQEVSAACSGLAKVIEQTLPESAEKSAGLRKLLEAKDCFVRGLL